MDGTTSLVNTRSDVISIVRKYTIDLLSSDDGYNKYIKEANSTGRKVYKLYKQHFSSRRGDYVYVESDIDLYVLCEMHDFDIIKEANVTLESRNNTVEKYIFDRRKQMIDLLYGLESKKILKRFSISCLSGRYDICFNGRYLNCTSLIRDVLRNITNNSTKFYSKLILTPNKEINSLIMSYNSAEDQVLHPGIYSSRLLNSSVTSLRRKKTIFRQQNHVILHAKEFYDFVLNCIIYPNPKIFCKIIEKTVGDDKDSIYCISDNKVCNDDIDYNPTYQAFYDNDRNRKMIRENICPYGKKSLVCLFLLVMKKILGRKDFHRNTFARYVLSKYFEPYIYNKYFILKNISKY